ncbi:hypothetical protein GOODEAATRI_001246 [Goodea atripinnis]|uniref:Uncharacterized protein n=1 Tax=Goodea atripinnis TaxID=208336 RepID=A0ABV0P0T0_9TELE
MDLCCSVIHTEPLQLEGVSDVPLRGGYGALGGLLGACQDSEIREIPNTSCSVFSMCWCPHVCCGAGSSFLQKHHLDLSATSACPPVRAYSLLPGETVTSAQ